MLDTLLSEIQLSDIQCAAERIAGIARHTPVFTSRTFDALTGTRVFFKCENFQRGGAFKIRGAANFVLSIPTGELRHGVVAYSSGNHGQAVAIAAESLGIADEILRTPVAGLAERTWTQSTAADLRRLLVQQIENLIERKLITVPVLEFA